MFRLCSGFLSLLIGDAMTVGYERSEESWLEYDYAQILNARLKACEFLGLEHSQTISNFELCKTIGLTCDIYRPQRLIRWALESLHPLP